MGWITLSGIGGTWLQSARISLGRLKKALFGSRTERLRDVAEDAKLANALPDDASPGDHAAGGEAPASRSVAVVTRRHKGHGRNGADAYRGSSRSAGGATRRPIGATGATGPATSSRPVSN